MLGPVTKSDSPKILKPTHFSGCKDIKTKKFVFNLNPQIFLTGLVGLYIE
jgi:hypothetical protein